MPGAAELSFYGNVTQAPELRTTPAGHVVCNFVVAVTDRRKAPDSGGYVDGDTAFYRCAAWKDLGAHAAESLNVGDRVLVVGQLVPRTFTTTDAPEVKRTSLDVNVSELGLSLRFHAARSARPSRSGPASASASEHSTGTRAAVQLV